MSDVLAHVCQYVVYATVPGGLHNAQSFVTQFQTLGTFTGYVVNNVAYLKSVAFDESAVVVVVVDSPSNTAFVTGVLAASCPQTCPRVSEPCPSPACQCPLQSAAEFFAGIAAVAPNATPPPPPPAPYPVFFNGCDPTPTFVVAAATDNGFTRGSFDARPCAFTARQLCFLGFGLAPCVEATYIPWPSNPAAGSVIQSSAERADGAVLHVFRLSVQNARTATWSVVVLPNTPFYVPQLDNPLSPGGVAQARMGHYLCPPLT